MTTLRDKVLALAASLHEQAHNSGDLALAVARMVVEECANAARGVAASDSGLRTQARIIAALAELEKP